MCYLFFEGNYFLFSSSADCSVGTATRDAVLFSLLVFFIFEDFVFGPLDVYSYARGVHDGETRVGSADSLQMLVIHGEPDIARTLWTIANLTRSILIASTTGITLDIAEVFGGSQELLSPFVRNTHFCTGRKHCSETKRYF